jgi:hypothetical protein
LHFNPRLQAFFEIVPVDTSPKNMQTCSYLNRIISSSNAPPR